MVVFLGRSALHVVVVVVWALAQLLAVNVAATELVRAWTILPPGPRPLLRASLASQQNSQDFPLRLDFRAIANQFLSKPERNRNDIGPASTLLQEHFMLFEFPNRSELQNCTLLPSNVLPNDLVEKYPKLIQRRGYCNADRRAVLFLNLDLDAPTSFSAAFFDLESADWLYVDHVRRADYVMYFKRSRRATATAAAAAPFSCSTKKKQKQRHRSLASPAAAAAPAPSELVGATIRLAVAVNRDYAQFAGDTAQSVLNSVAGVLSRINGIYMRELGIFFQLAPRTDRLFCVQGALANCALLPNLDANAVLRNVDSFIASRGVASSSFDLGHVLTTGSGGLAYVGVLCENNYKAKGTTGVATPLGDAFAVDYVAHELGHQLNGEHSFRDCGEVAATGGMQSVSAVEPGAGTTIMGYAGICGPRNVQLHSDAYLHAVNLPSMKEYIHSRLSLGICGANKLRSNGGARRVQVFPIAQQQCQIPVGSAFALRGNASAEASFFQWEHVDVGQESYFDLNLPRFRSWKPHTSATRYFPNLLYLANKWTEQMPYALHERLPTQPVLLRFRFLARSLFDADANNVLRNAELMGDFAYRDIAVRFVNDYSRAPPLQFTAQTRLALETQELFAGALFTFEWTGGEKEDWLEILAAPASLVLRESGPDSAASWTLVGRARAGARKASFVLPVLLSSHGNTSMSTSFMIQTSNADSVCLLFDLVGRAQVTMPPSPLVPSHAPSSLAPTSPTTLAPTRAVAIPLELGNNTRQELSTCIVGEPQCDYEAPQAACAGATRVVVYTFTAPFAGAYIFSTQQQQQGDAAMAMVCMDTVLFAMPSARCNDDVGPDNAKSELELFLLAGEETRLFVGGYADSCGEGSTVALHVRAATPVPTLVPTVAATTTMDGFALEIALGQTLVHGMHTCTVPHSVCPLASANEKDGCSMSTNVVAYHFTAPHDARFTFSTANAETTCWDTTLFAVERKLCNDDIVSQPYSSARSSLDLDMVAGENATLLVGGYGNWCGRDTTVSLQVTSLNSSPTLSPTKLATPTLSPTLFVAPTLSPTLFASPTASPIMLVSPTVSPIMLATPTSSPTKLDSLQQEEEDLILTISIDTPTASPLSR